jgi:uncharacterized membrane protein YgcG
MELAEALKIGRAESEAEAENMLALVGIAPQNGWMADHPVTPDIIGELHNAIAAAADSGKIAMNKSEAIEVFEDLVVEIESQYARIEPPYRWQPYPDIYYYPYPFYYTFLHPYPYYDPYPYYYGGYYGFYRPYYYPYRYPYYRGGFGSRGFHGGGRGGGGYHGGGRSGGGSQGGSRGGRR